MKPTHLQELVDELELLKENDNLDKQTLNVVLWIATEYLICEEAQNIGMKLQERMKFYKKETNEDKDL
jgi:hypothetical protein